MFFDFKKTSLSIIICLGSSICFASGGTYPTHQSDDTTSAETAEAPSSAVTEDRNSVVTALDRQLYQVPDTCQDGVRDQMINYCRSLMSSGDDCGYFFRALPLGETNPQQVTDFAMLRPANIEQIRSRMDDIRAASQRFNVPIENLIATLIAVQVKDGYQNQHGVSGATTQTNSASQAEIDSALQARCSSGCSNSQREEIINELNCDITTGWNSLSRLDHNGPSEANQAWAQYSQPRQRPLSCVDLKAAINEEGRDIEFMAAKMRRDQELLEDKGFANSPATAATLYGLEDVERTLQRVASENRQPRPNSWGYYAQCRMPLVNELLGQ